MKCDNCANHFLLTDMFIRKNYIDVLYIDEYMVDEIKNDKRNNAAEIGTDDETTEKNGC